MVNIWGTLVPPPLPPGLPRGPLVVNRGPLADPNGVVIIVIGCACTYCNWDQIEYKTPVIVNGI